MPFKSKAQQRWMFANKPRMAKRWAKETKSFKRLPEKVASEYVAKGFHERLQKLGMFFPNPVSATPRGPVPPLSSQLGVNAKAPTNPIPSVAQPNVTTGPTATGSR